MKEKKLKDLFEMEAESVKYFSTDVKVVKDGQNTYMFPPKMKKYILNRKVPTGKSAKDINKRCETIQKWLVAMKDHIDVVHDVLKKNPKDPCIAFLRGIGIKSQAKNIPYHYECLKVAWDIMPEAWRV